MPDLDTLVFVQVQSTGDESAIFVRVVNVSSVERRCSWVDSDHCLYEMEGSEFLTHCFEFLKTYLMGVIVILKDIMK